jgi:hypothetical protein
MAIYQGDQYSIPFMIRRGADTVSPEMITDVVIAIGDIVRSYKDGALSYLDGKWLFPIYKTETLKMPDEVQYQIQLHIGDDIVHSKVYPIKRKTILDSLKERLQND